MQATDRLERWLRDGGAVLSRVELQSYSKEHRGVHASNDIASAEDIVFVPVSHIMTTQVAKASPIGHQLMEQQHLLRSKHTYLACYLLVERERPDSFWKPYMEALPQTYSNMPINFTPEEKQWLKGSMCLDKMHERVTSLEAEYTAVCSIVPSFQQRFSMVDFSWARHVVITRIFGMVIRGTKTEGLVPYADLLNHKRPRDTRWAYEDARGGFVITALRPIAKGEQVFDSYGSKCNHRFFVNYGFALLDNPDNETVLYAAVSPGHDAYHDKCALLQQAGYSSSRVFQIPASTKDRKARELLSFARFAVCSRAELRRVAASYTFAIDELPPLSKETEIKALHMIQEAAKACLARFDTSLQQDEALLQTVSESNVYHAVVMRRGEKIVASFFVQLCSTMIHLLSLSMTELHSLENYNNLAQGPYADYLHHVLRPLLLQ